MKLKRTLIAEAPEKLLTLLSRKLKLNQNRVCHFLKEEDLPSGVELEIRAHDLEPSSGVTFNTPEKIEDLVKILYEYQSKEQIFSIIDSDSKYIGHVGFKKNDKVGQLSFLTVSPDHQGQGISYSLLYAAITELKQRGCSEIQASTSNEKLVSLLRKSQIYHNENIQYDNR